jgi:bifunctional dethiobiotin synthetase / adenosylmethionine---8-amino-7-oxononanoate aminotransferase
MLSTSRSASQGFRGQSSLRRLSTLLKDTVISKECQSFVIFGANTDVGKTVVSAGLVRTSPYQHIHYIEPLQCGGSDQQFVKDHAPNVTSIQTLFEWESFSSPHTASRHENLPISDDQVHASLKQSIEAFHSNTSQKSNLWIETAGGVLSPSSASPDNTSPEHCRGADAGANESWGWKTQGDLYQNVPLPVVLVGDGRLGGISATLTTLESLWLRNYSVVGLVLIESEGFYNRSALVEYASRYVCNML